MSESSKSHTQAPSEEERSVSASMRGTQIYLPITVGAKNGRPRASMPRESRDVRYIRYIDHLTGVVRFVPALNPDCDHGIEVVARLDGERRTYAPMPDGTEGVRYRRVRDRATGIITLTPIRCTQRRGTKWEEEQ